MLRDEIAEKFKWDLSSIIENDEKWEELFIKVSEDYRKLTEFKGRLISSDAIYECFEKQSALSQQISRLYVYARMRLDEDANASQYQSLTERIELLNVKISVELSFIMPEISSCDSALLDGLLKEERFRDHDYAIKEIIRNKKHILSESEERIMSEVGSFSDGFHDAFNMFDNADITFDDVIDRDGKHIAMSHGIYGSILQSGNRNEREQAFKSMFGAFRKMNNTLTQLYAGNVKANVFYAKVRGFDSALDKAVFGENVHREVYEKLIENVRDSLPIMHDYIALRKKLLGYEELHCWDLHVPIVDGQSLRLEYGDACKLVKKALAPLGSEYAELLDRAFNDRWIDVYETKGKRSGAYSWGCYTSHPYVLLNYQPVTNEVFTIAHELGHAMHSYYSNISQPYPKAGYEIFVAEVASTVNEVLLLKYLMSECDSEMRKYLLSYYLDMFRTTLFRQTQFAEFEQVAHAMAESDTPLTAETLNGIYYDLNKKYYGGELEHDELIKYEWSRIPHFYRSFYVYKYATGLTSAVTIANAVFNEEKNAVENYKKFLSLGGSMPPEDILKVAGVDLQNDEPYRICMKEFKATLEELKSLCDK